MPDDPLALLTRWISQGTISPDEKTRMSAKEQLQMYLAFDFAVIEYGMTFLKAVTLEDKALMMALQGKRSEEIVDAMKGFKAPMGMDVGMQPERYLARPKGGKPDE